MSADESYAEWFKRMSAPSPKWTDEKIEKLAEAIVAYRAQQHIARPAGAPLASSGNVIDARERFARRQ